MVISPLSMAIEDTLDVGLGAVYPAPGSFKGNTPFELVDSDTAIFAVSAKFKPSITRDLIV